MRRTLATLVAATSLALGGTVLIAGPAAAAPGDPGLPADAAVQAADERSVLNHCPGTSGNQHPGLHQGWSRSDNGERRNLGGRCLSAP